VPRIYSLYDFFELSFFSWLFFQFIGHCKVSAWESSTFASVKRSRTIPEERQRWCE
jgi:hypothetical protein